MMSLGLEPGAWSLQPGACRPISLQPVACSL
jgi:hypothetical protein